MNFITIENDFTEQMKEIIGTFIEDQNITTSEELNSLIERKCSIFGAVVHEFLLDYFAGDLTELID